MFQNVDFNYINTYDEKEFIKNVKEQFNHWNKNNQTFYEDCLGMDAITTIIKNGDLKFQKDLIIYYQGSLFRYNYIYDLNNWYIDMCVDMIMEYLWNEFD